MVAWSYGQIVVCSGRQLDWFAVLEGGWELMVVGGSGIVFATIRRP